MNKLNNREWKSYLKAFSFEEESFVVLDTNLTKLIISKDNRVDKFRGNHYFLVNAFQTPIGVRVERGKKNIIIHKSLLDTLDNISCLRFHYSDIRSYKDKAKTCREQKKADYISAYEERLNTDPVFAKKIEQDKKRDNWIMKTKDINLDKSTPAERFLYTHALKRFGKRVKAQYEIITNGHIYFLDFYIKSMHVAIEVDGGYHGTIEQSDKDRERDKNLSSIGIKTIRIKNEQVYDDLCINELLQFLEKRRFYTRATADHSVDTLYIGLKK